MRRLSSAKDYAWKLHWLHRRCHRRAFTNRQLNAVFRALGYDPAKLVLETRRHASNGRQSTRLMETTT